MLTSTKNKPLVGLDIEAGSIAATEVRQNGRDELAGFGVMALDAGVFREGEVADVEGLTEALKQLWSEQKLTKDIRLGIANQRVAVRTLRLPVIEDHDELDTAIRFQAQDQLPMPLDQSVLDWQTVGRTPVEDGSERLDVIAVAARRDMLGKMLDAVRGAGLRPRGFDLSAFGMVRALHTGKHASVTPGDFVTAPAPGAPSYEERIRGADAAVDSAPAYEPEPTEAAMVDVTPARLYCNLGDVTNLAVARGSVCLFTRVSPFGMEGIAQKLAERRGLTLEHAREWLSHVGLQRPIEEIDGDAETVRTARDCLAEGSARLVDELRGSLEYYSALDAAVPVEGVVACGPGATIEGLAERLQRELGQRFEVGRAGALAHLPEPEAARLTLSFGLALEE